MRITNIRVDCNSKGEYFCDEIDYVIVDNFENSSQRRSGELLWSFRRTVNGRVKSAMRREV